MSEPAKQPAPPYVGYETFKNAIRSLGTTGHLPERIDNTVFTNLSGSTRAQLMQTLKYLELVDEKGAPTKSLRELASGSELEWKSAAKVLANKYYPVQVKALETGTVGSFKESFGDIGGIVTPAARFLLAMANDAGLKVSGYIKEIPSGPARKKKDISRFATAPAPVVKPPNESLTGDAFTDALIKKFPDFDPNWNDAQQDRWFAAYDRLMNLKRGGAT